MFIIFVVSIIKSLITMLTREEKRRKKKLKEELNFFLDNYKEISIRGNQIRQYFDDKIDELVEELKQMGK